MIPETCCKNITTVEACKEATKLKSGETHYDSPLIHLKVSPLLHFGDLTQLQPNNNLIDDSITGMLGKIASRGG